MRAPLRRTLFFLLAIFVFAALLYRFRGAILIQGFSWPRLWANLADTRWYIIVLSAAGIYLGYAIRSLRWIRFSRYLGRPRFAGVYRATVIGFTGLFLLGRPGEPIRPLLIARNEDLPVSGMFGTYILERIFDGIATFALAGVAMLFLPPTVFSHREAGTLFEAARTGGLFLLGFILLAALFLVYFRVHGADALERAIAGWRNHPGARARLAGLFSGFSAGLGAIRTLADLFYALLFSSAHWLLMGLIYYVILHAFPGRLAEFDYMMCLIVLAFTMVGAVAQLPAIGGGSQIVCYVVFTGVFGVDNESAAAASIAIWLVTFAASTLLGIPLLVREGLSFGELRRLARAEQVAEDAGTHVAVAPALEPAAIKRGEASR